MKPFLVAAAVASVLGLSAFAPLPALAQAAPGEKVNQLIVYGDDPCPESVDGAITVCARKDESERFRIPPPLRDNPNAAVNQSWTDRVKAYETVGAAGAYSCSPVGSAGASGCMAKLINQAYAEKKQSTDVQMGKLIEAEREKRLKSIDADAAAEQARVEQLEKEYDARIARERAAEASPSPAAPSATPAPGSLATPPQD